MRSLGLLSVRKTVGSLLSELYKGPTGMEDLVQRDNMPTLMVKVKCSIFIIGLTLVLTRLCWRLLLARCHLWMSCCVGQLCLCRSV